MKQLSKAAGCELQSTWQHREKWGGGRGETSPSQTMSFGGDAPVCVYIFLNIKAQPPQNKPETLFHIWSRSTCFFHSVANSAYESLKLLFCTAFEGILGLKK